MSLDGKGACPIGSFQGIMSKGVVEMTVSLHFTKALNSFKVLFKWSKSKEIQFHTMIRVWRFSGYWVRGVVYLNSFIKF